MYFPLLHPRTEIKHFREPDEDYFYSVNQGRLFSLERYCLLILTLYDFWLSTQGLNSRPVSFNSFYQLISLNQIVEFCSHKPNVYFFLIKVSYMVSISMLGVLGWLLEHNMCADSFNCPIVPFRVSIT